MAVDKKVSNMIYLQSHSSRPAAVRYRHRDNVDYLHNEIASGVFIALSPDKYVNDNILRIFGIVKPKFERNALPASISTATLATASLFTWC
ncbi:hypothetical protein C7W93_19940 [Glaciimonas sp. PCH181]|nr:hypothetical protein C7W93_19940 [Glaciimonas sp. PCH181]